MSKLPAPPAAPLSPLPLGEAAALTSDKLRALLSDYYLSQITRARIDFYNAHEEALLTLPFTYRSGEHMSVCISVVGDGFYRLSDGEVVGSYLYQFRAELSVKRYNLLCARIDKLLEDSGCAVDMQLGLWKACKADTFVESLHTFIQMMIRIDALIWRECLELNTKAPELKKGGVA